MGTSNIKPIVAIAPVSREAELSAAEVQAVRRKSSHPVIEDQTSVTGQFSLEGVTAYYSVKHGNMAVFQLVEDATGKVIREVAPEQMMRISSAIDQILNRERETADSSKSKE